MFILPEHSFGEHSEIILCQQERSDKLYRQSGSLADWQEHVAHYCIGNSRLLLAVSCAFAAMLLHPTQMESGGLHLVGESSSGKTTALRVAASVLGGHDYLHRWRATTNGLEALAVAHCDTLLILDELAQVEAKEAGEIAYMLANGSGKARAHKSGAAKRHAEWRTLFISAGEIGLSQHMQEVGKRVRAGQEVRLIDLPADANNGLGIFDTCHEIASAPTFSQKLVKASAQYYGTAGIAFLKLITQKEHFTSLVGNFDSFKKIFLQACLPLAASGQVYRVAERFALIAFAGELASEHSITGWPEEMAFEVMGRCFQDWLNQRGSHNNQESTAMLQQVQAFLETHALSRFELLRCGYQSNPQSSESLIIHNRVGFRKINEIGETEYLILPEMFRREICQGFDHRQVCKILVQAGMLKQNQDGKNLTAHRLPGEGIKKCYHLIKTVPSNQLMNDDGS